MSTQPHPTYTAFIGPHCIASGDLHAVVTALRAKRRREHDPAPLLFRDDSGEQIDIDLRRNQDEANRGDAPAQSEAHATSAAQPGPKTRGRPKLGVVAREVTLLPEHWDWLAAQPGGASVALRKLVHEARKASAGRDQRRQAQERAYRVMSALAGNLPGFEETSRALFAGDLNRLRSEAQAWPADILDYVLRLAGPAKDAGTSTSKG